MFAGEQGIDYFIPEEEDHVPKRAAAVGRSGSKQRLQQQFLDALSHVSPPVPRQGYEKLRMDYGFDILSLSPLTTVHFSRAVASALANEPSRLQQLMQMPVLSSFLDCGMSWLARFCCRAPQPLHELTAA